jgi:acetyl esterase
VLNLPAQMSPWFLGGDSAGANLATVVTRKLHEMRSCSVAGNVLAYPCTDNGTATSLTRFEPPFLKLDELCWFLDQYLPDHALRKHPDFAPLNATNMGVLPPTLIITAEHDILTEQAEEYGRKLQAAGVHVRTNRHPGMIHGFLTMDAFFAGAAGEAMHEIRNFISHL